MAITYVDLNEQYQAVSNDNDINVDVMIGDAQVGTWSVHLGRDRRSSDQVLNIGNKSMVTGKTVTIIATVTDTLEETNWTSITVRFREGTHTKTFGPYKKLAPAHLDTIIYTLQIVCS